MRTRSNRFAATLMAITAACLAINCPASAQSPALADVLSYGGPGDQLGTGLALTSSGLYVSGYQGNEQMSLALAYSRPLGSAPVWAVTWPGGPFSPFGEGFHGVAASSDGVYFAGDSYAQTTDGIGDKEGKCVLVGFPLNGPVGPGVGGAQWIARPEFFPFYRGFELFSGTTGAVEGGQTYIYAAGLGQSNGANTTAVVAKYDTSGAQLWSRALSGTGFNQGANGAAVTTLNGSVYVAGYTQTVPSPYEAMLWKLDPAGNLMWTRSLPFAGADAFANGVATDGHYLYVVGSQRPGPNGHNDVLVLKYDESGTLLASYVWGGAADDIAYGVAASSVGVFVVGETSSFGSGGRDAFLLQLDTNLTGVMSATFYGGAQDDVANAIGVSGSDVYVVGSSRSFASADGNAVGQSDVMLLHYLLAANDATAPTTTASVAGPAGNNGWYTGDVSVTLSASDPDDAASDLTTYYALDGGSTQTYAGPVAISGDGSHTLAYWSVDKAGNTETQKLLSVNIDGTPPTLSWGSASPDANAFGWNNSPVDVPFTTADNLSGVASVSTSSPLHFSSEGAGQTQTVIVTDAAGNTATFTSPAVSLDMTAPLITITSPAAQVYLLNQSVTVSFTVEDALSGVDPTTITATAASGGALDTSSVGNGTFSVSASDSAGNPASKSVSYMVAYGASALYDQTKARQSGSTYPIKLQLVDAAGANVSSSAVVVHATATTQISGTPTGLLDDSGAANPDYDFRFDPTMGGTGGYIFNLSLKGYAPGIYVLHFRAGNDPTDHTVQFQVR